MTRTHLTLACALLGAVALSGCRRDEGFISTLRTPGAVAVLDAIDASPYPTPIGIGVERHSGRIRLLHLRRGVQLQDGPFASFYRGATLGTGASRVLTHVAVTADAGRTTVFALDASQSQLLTIPWITGTTAEGYPERPTPRTFGFAASYVEGDPQEAQARIRGQLNGVASTEQWTATRLPSGWLWRGSRSGPEPRLAQSGVPAVIGGGALAVLIEGRALPGTEVSFQVDSGLRELDLPGRGIDLAHSPDHDQLVLTVRDANGASAWKLNPEAPALDAPLPLPAGASPGRVAWQDNHSLWIADTEQAVAWQVDLLDDVATPFTVDAPLLDLAPVTLDDGSVRLVTLHADARTVRVWDVDSGDAIDANLLTPESDGVVFEAPVQGIAASPVAHGRLGSEERTHSIAASTGDGRVMFVDPRSGCLLPDRLGPRTEVLRDGGTQGDFSPNFTVDRPRTPWLQPAEDRNRHINVHPCAGVARAEQWEVTFDATLQGWRVFGERSGEQVRIAREDERYLSDDGSVSFLIRAGANATPDGAGFTFRVNPGMLAIDGDNVDDGNREANLDMPSRPVWFQTLIDGDLLTRVLIGSGAGDLFARVNPENADVDATWD